MKFFTNKKFSNKLIILLIFLTLFNFIFPCIVRADEVTIHRDNDIEDGVVKEYMESHNHSYKAEKVDKWYKMDADIGGIMYAGMFWIVKSAYTVFNNIFCDSDHKFEYKVTSDGIEVNAGLSAESIIKGKFLLTNPNIFEKVTDDNADEFYDGKKSSIVSGKNSLRNVVTGWYYALRNFSIVAMLIVLVYVSIRMITSSISQDKSKFKRMFKDWFVALCLLITMHYIMIGMLNITSLISDTIGVSGSCSSQIEGLFQKAGTINQAEHRYNITIDGEKVNGVRAVLISENDYEFYNLGDGFIYLILVLIVGFFTVNFTVKYIKRMLIIIFLILLGPITCITYPIDKVGDSKAQAYNKWFTEILYNILVQPFHLLIYTVLVGTATELANENIIYSICCFAVIFPAEKFIKGMFGFKNSLGPNFGDLARMKMIGDTINSLKGNSNNKDKKDDSVKFDSKKSYEYAAEGQPKQKNHNNEIEDPSNASTGDNNIDNSGNFDDNTKTDDDIDNSGDFDDNIETDDNDTDNSGDFDDDTESDDNDIGNSGNPGNTDNSITDNSSDNTSKKLTDKINNKKKSRINDKKPLNERIKEASTKIKEDIASDIVSKYKTGEKGKIFAKVAGNSVKALAKSGLSATGILAKTGWLYATGRSQMAGGYLVSNAIKGAYNATKPIRGAVGTVKKHAETAKDTIFGDNKKMEKYKNDAKIKIAKDLYKKTHKGKVPNATELNDTLEKMYALEEAGVTDLSVMELMLDENSQLDENYNNEMYKLVCIDRDNREYSKKDFLNTKNLNTLYDTYITYLTKKGSTEQKADQIAKEIIFKIATIKDIPKETIENKLNTLDKRQAVKVEQEKIKVEQEKIKVEQEKINAVKPYVVELKLQGIEKPTQEQIELQIELHTQLEQKGFDIEQIKELSQISKYSDSDFNVIVNQAISECDGKNFDSIINKIEMSEKYGIKDKESVDKIRKREIDYKKILRNKKEKTEKEIEDRILELHEFAYKQNNGKLSKKDKEKITYLSDMESKILDLYKKK